MARPVDAGAALGYRQKSTRIIKYILKFKKMKKLILSTMALVLGLFTVTAVLAFSISEVSFKALDEEHFLDQSIPNPQDSWSDENSWLEDQQAGDIPCSSGNIACKITVPSSFSSLEAYLMHLRDVEEITWSTLASHPSVIPRSTQ